MNPLDLPPFQALLRERCALAFEQQTQDKLASTLAARMDALGLRMPSAYLARLRADQAELQTLINRLTVNETYFFREPEQLRLLIERLIPRMLQQREQRKATDEPIRLLSAGCSSGEEAYSLIMGLSEIHGDHTATLFEVIGGDIDSVILEKARAGRYGRFSFRGVSAERQQRFFKPSGRDFEVVDWIRTQARFVTLNLSAPAPGLGRFDAILYRNVSIYFDSPTRARVLRNLAELLKPEGYLIVGTSETLGNDLGLLTLHQEDGLFYFVNRRPTDSLSTPEPSPPPSPGKPTRIPSAATPAGAARATQRPPPRSNPPKQPAPQARPVSTTAPEHPSPPATDSQQVQQLIREQRFDDALQAVAQRLDAAPNETETLLLDSYLLLERRAFAAAEQRARQVLEHNPWLADAWLLLGLAAKWRDQPDPALSAFKRVLYIQPNCWPAHFYLGELYRARGEMPLASRAWRAAARLLANDPPTASGLQLSILEPPAQMARYLCERHLAPTSAARQ
jgi:chemotaxis protein methyltransferase CheR